MDDPYADDNFEPGPVSDLYKQIEKNKFTGTKMYTLIVSAIGSRLYSEVFLRKLFSEHGDVKKITLTSRSRDRKCCFISYDSLSSANAAIRYLDDNPIYNLKVRFHSSTEHIFENPVQKPPIKLLGPLPNAVRSFLNDQTNDCSILATYADDRNKIDRSSDDSGFLIRGDDQSPMYTQSARNYTHPARVLDEKIDRFITISPKWDPNLNDVSVYRYIGVPAFSASKDKMPCCYSTQISDSEGSDVD